MGLRVNTNIEAIQIHNTLSKVNDKVSKSLQRLSSGYRVNSAKDDASGYAVANAFRAKISGLNVAKQNATEANSMLQIADGAYNKIHDILIRMKDLATQAASGQTENREKLQTEFAALQCEINRIAYSTTYSTSAHDVGSAASLALVSGDSIANSGTGITFQIGSTNTATATTSSLGASYQMSTASASAQESNVLALKLDAACAGALGVDGGTSGISLSSLASAQMAMSKIDIALGCVNSAMSKVGALQNRLDFTIDNLSTQIENFSASESAIRDVDMAAEVVNFTKNQILQQAGMAMLAQANQAPQQVLQLLGG